MSQKRYGLNQPFGFGRFVLGYAPENDPSVAMLLHPHSGVYQARTGESANDPPVMRTQPVGTWADAASRGYGTAASDADRPTWHPFGVNCTQGVLFNGVDQRLGFAADFGHLFRNRSHAYLFLNVRPTAEATAGTAFYWSTNGSTQSRLGVVFNSGGSAGRLNISARRNDGDSATSRSVDGAFSEGEVLTLAIELDYLGNEVNAWKNETQIIDSVFSSSSPGPSSNTASAAAWLGANAAGSAYYDGLLGHVLVCTPTRKFSAAEIMARQRWMMRQVAFEQVEPPVELTFTPAIEVWKRGSEYRTTWDRSLHDVARATTFYVDPDNGNGSNDGLTPETALKTLTSAITKANLETSAEIILTRAGSGYDGGGGATAVSVPVTIRSPNGLAILSQGIGGQSFTTDEGAGAWSAASHSAVEVYDFAFRDEYGEPMILDAATDLAQCQATPGTFVVVSGRTVVHLSDSRQPDTMVCTATSSTGRRLAFTGASVFLENVAQIGANASNLYVGHAGTTVLAALGCEFHRTRNDSSDNVVFDVDGSSYLVDCLVTDAGADNIDYRDAAGTHVGHEINVRSHRAGRSPGSACNCSTAHDGSKVVRVNGLYRQPRHRAVHDVSAGTESWNVNCEAEAGSQTDNYPPGAWSVGLNDTAAPKMFLENCRASGGADHFQVFGQNSEMHISNMVLTGAVTGSDRISAS